MALTTGGTIAQLKELEGALQTRLHRVRSNLLSITQGSVAAGLSYWVAHSVFHHERPFFAPMAAVIILGLSTGTRLRRAVELSIGCCLGVGLGDVLIGTVGTGDWQIALAVFVSLAVASFLSTSQLLINQVAIGSILIATILPPGTSGTYGRMIDAVIGCTVGIFVVALLPHSPLASGRREVARVLKIASSVLADVARALKTNDASAIQSALELSRGTQAAINKMQLQAKSSQENAIVSPVLWATRPRVRSFIRILDPVDNAVRNTRVLARRAQILSQDGDKVSEDQIEIIEELSEIMNELAEVYLKHTDKSEAIAIPEISRRLRYLGARCSLSIAQGRVLSAQVILAQSRSIIVDLLMVCGLSRESALSTLALTTDSPAFHPEIMDVDKDE